MKRKDGRKTMNDILHQDESNSAKRRQGEPIKTHYMGVPNIIDPDKNRVEKAKETTKTPVMTPKSEYVDKELEQRLEYNRTLNTLDPVYQELELYGGLVLIRMTVGGYHVLGDKFYSSGNTIKVQSKSGYGQIDQKDRFCFNLSGVVVNIDNSLKTAEFPVRFNVGDAVQVRKDITVSRPMEGGYEAYPTNIFYLDIHDNTWDKLGEPGFGYILCYPSDILINFGDYEQFKEKGYIRL